MVRMQRIRIWAREGVATATRGFVQAQQLDGPAAPRCERAKGLNLPRGVADPAYASNYRKELRQNDPD